MPVFLPIDETTGNIMTCDNRVTLNVDTDRPLYDSCYICLLWLAQLQPAFTDPNDVEMFGRFIALQNGDIIRFIDQWKNHLDKSGDVLKIIGTVFAKPKSLSGAPPLSHCPRCDEKIWRTPEPVIDDDGHPVYDAAWWAMANDVYNRNPAPRYCLNCGQQFKTMDGQIDYRATRFVHNIKAQFKILANAQPTLFDTKEIVPHA